MKILQKQKNKGFTLIEMLIAVLIFTLSLATLMTMTSRGLRVSQEAQDQIVADYLALEGIELVRNIRDSVHLRQLNVPTWTNVFDVDGCLTEEIQNGTENSGCAPSITTSGTALMTRLLPCSNSNCHRVYYNPLRYTYVQGTGVGSLTPTKFYRRVKFIPVPENNKEIIVRVIVEWDNNRRVVEYSEDLYLWLSL